ncbi:hypothetical protein HAX54_040099, partial [Datura stramonium]|nr:hypothetical protein [Datura stramonium]
NSMLSYPTNFLLNIDHTDVPNSYGQQVMSTDFESNTLILDSWYSSTNYPVESWCEDQRMSNLASIGMRGMTFRGSPATSGDSEGGDHELLLLGRTYGKSRNGSGDFP